MGDNPDWTARRLEIILRNLERMSDQYTVIQTHFPRWRDRRLLTAATIDEFKSKLDYVFQKACVAGGVGAASSLLGTISSIVGVFLSWKGISASTSWVSVGSKLSAAGNIVVPAVSLVEYGFSASYMSEVQEYLNMDQEASRPLLQFLEYSRDLDTVIQEVFGCSIYSDTWQDVLACWNEAIEINTNVCTDTRNIANLVRRRLRGKIPEDIIEEIGDALRRNLGRMLNSSKLGGLRALRRIGEFVRTPHVSMAISSVKVYVIAQGIWEGELARSPLTKIEWGKTGKWSITGHCLLEAANIVVDVTNLIQRYNGYIDGQSNYSRRLEEIKQQLLRELTTLENSILLNRFDRNP